MNLGQLPYYLVETVVLVGVILMTLFFIFRSSDFDSAIPLLTLYCMNGFKLVPKVQQSYLATTQIKGSQAAFENTYRILQSAKQFQNRTRKESRKIVFKEYFVMDNIAFQFSEKRLPILESINLTIPKGKTVAITGVSGSGKSTLLNIVMGLLIPSRGAIIIDGEKLEEEHILSWQNQIGYVPQEIYLSDTTIEENISFGFKGAADLDRLKEVLDIAQLTSFINSLPQKEDTLTGERGMQLSGGQKQRIGIARALYRDIELLVLDEATSALDDETQFEILNNIKTRYPQLTIIMVTHRAETMSFADISYDINDLKKIES